MLKRILLVALAFALTGTALAFALTAAAVAAEAPGTGCKESADLVGQCFAVHGRLSWHANGRPYLQPAGTSRLLGFPREVAGLRRWLPEAVDPTAPGSIYQRAAPRASDGVSADEVEVTGDFLVCPVSKEKPRTMRMVCMESAANLALRPRARASPEE
jgi:hypothetical protein